MDATDLAFMPCDCEHQVRPVRVNQPVDYRRYDMCRVPGCVAAQEAVLVGALWHICRDGQCGPHHQMMMTRNGCRGVRV